MHTLTEHQVSMVSGGSLLGAIGAVGGFVLAGLATHHPVLAVAGGAAGYVAGETLNQAVDDALADPAGGPEETPGN